MMKAITGAQLPYCYYELQHMHYVIARKASQITTLENLLLENGFTPSDVTHVRNGLSDATYSSGWSGSGRTLYYRKASSTKYVARFLLVNKDKGSAGGRVLVVKYSKDKNNSPLLISCEGQETSYEPTQSVTTAQMMLTPAKSNASASTSATTNEENDPDDEPDL